MSLKKRKAPSAKKKSRPRRGEDSPGVKTVDPVEIETGDGRLAAKRKDGRAKNGAKPGSNNGGGRKPANPNSPIARVVLALRSRPQLEQAVEGLFNELRLFPENGPTGKDKRAKGRLIAEINCCVGLLRFLLESRKWQEQLDRSAREDASAQRMAELERRLAEANALIEKVLAREGDGIGGHA